MGAWTSTTTSSVFEVWKSDSFVFSYTVVKILGYKILLVDRLKVQRIPTPSHCQLQKDEQTYKSQKEITFLYLYFKNT